MIREKCLLCSSDIKELFSFKMPVYMGVNYTPDDEIYEEMIFAYCSSCGEVQIKKLIDLDVLYQANHNNGVIGKIWKDHYIEFASFISKFVEDREVLEISDPSAKLPPLIDGFKRWTIIEPNPEEVNLEKVEFVNCFFNEPFEEKKDIIVHSHLLEHIYDPIKFLNDCSASLKDDGDMFISIPDLEFILNNEYSPNNILHFEHTYFINEGVLNFLLNKNNLYIVDKKNFKNHSVFYHIKKGATSKIVPPQLDLALPFVRSFKKHKKSIFRIKKSIEENKNIEWYIFGSHVSSQFYLNNGLDEILFKGTLDNSKFKQGHLLYGSNLMTYDPLIIKDKKKIGIVCSHSGIYFEEIRNQLKELNSEVLIV